MLDTSGDFNSALAALVQEYPDLWKLSACGVTKLRQGIPTLLAQDAYTSETKRVRVLLIGGLSGGTNDPGLALRALELTAEQAERLTPKMALSAVPWADLDAFMPDSDNMRDLSGGYTPADNFYFDSEAAEPRYLWRWICLQSPDLLLEIRSGDTVRWESNDAGEILPVTIGGS